MLRLVHRQPGRLSSSLVLERLARQLRDDAHASETARLEGAGREGTGAANQPQAQSCEPGHAITYKVLEKSVDRDETLAGKRVRHESYALPRGRQARFELGAEAGRAMVSLLVEPGPGIKPRRPPMPLEVRGRGGQASRRPDRRNRRGQRNDSSQQGAKPRRGMTVVAVLVCLLVMMLLGAALLKLALAEREQQPRSERRLQAEWLVESGLERARARLAADASYAGETWPLSAADLGLPEASETGSGRERRSRVGRGHDLGRSPRRSKPTAGGSAFKPIIPATGRAGRGIPRNDSSISNQRKLERRHDLGCVSCPIPTWLPNSAPRAWRLGPSP